MYSKRQKVRLQCKRCGEIFTLRGRVDKQGHVETGMKKCICDNEEDFQIIKNDL